MVVKYEVVESIKRLKQQTGYTLEKILGLYGIGKSTYHGWFDSEGNLKRPEEKKTKHLTQITVEEKKSVIEYRKKHKDVGYRKLTWMMVDENVVYLSESSVYNILSVNGMLYGWNHPDQGEVQKEYQHKPKRPHHHWHTDIAYIKIRNVFYFLIMVLDGYSRYLLGWDLMSDMTGRSVEMFIQEVKDKYPHARPMLIHDNGSQFISHDFKRLMTQLEIQSVPTRKYHPQTNGKAERWNGSVKNEAIRPNAPEDYQAAWDILNDYAYFYNHQRLHAGINYLRPSDMMFGRDKEILKQRQEKVKSARQSRIKINRERKIAA